MSGTIMGGKRASITNRSRHGLDFYSRLGRAGGSKSSPFKGFGSMEIERHKLLSAMGGRKSRRGAKIPVRVEKTIVSARLEYERMPWWRRFFT